MILSLGEVEGRDAEAGDSEPVRRIGFGWLACSKAVTNSCIEVKRWRGSLASAFRTTCSSVKEIVAIFSRNGGGGTNKCWLYSSVNVPEKGRSPHSHSYATIPNEY